MKPDPQDIIEDLSLVTPPNYSFWIGLSIVAVLVLSAASATIWFLYRNKKLPFQQAHPVSAHRSALADLEALRLLLAPERCREFVFEVSTVLRRYVEERFGLKAPTLSTEEFLWLAESDSTLTAEQRFMLGEFLNLCDRVKFALAGMEIDAMENLLNAAVRFVKETAQEAASQPTSTE